MQCVCMSGNGRGLPSDGLQVKLGLRRGYAAVACLSQQNGHLLSRNVVFKGV